MLVVDRIEKVYAGGRGGVAALRGVSFTVAPGDFIALMGPSGCGKSSLLHILGGMNRASAGRVTLNDVSFAALSEEELARLRRRQIGFVFQFFNLLPTLTVAENVALPLMLDGAAERETAARTRELLVRVGLADLGRPHT